MTNEVKRNEDTGEPLVRLSSSFTQIEMDPLDRDAAVRDAHFRTLSPPWTGAMCE